ncbi:IclR family transcriptional regulator domain-containing protein [Ottowia sp.]|uniref:IclR family transcriptional regulator domain-containing protein n=1 Tax=Ottowia sp. TaxID=1898956 RepID=UPI003A889C79
MPIADADFIAGMAKGMAVLESFDTQRQRLNATLAAQRAGLTRAAARRHLLTLAHLGYLESDGRYFWLSPKVLRFSGSYLATARLPRLVQPMLNQLALATRQGLSVVVLDGAEGVIVARGLVHSAPAQQAAELSAQGLHLGARLPAHATSTGRVLLAGLSSTELRAWLARHPLPRLTGQTITTASALKKIIAQVRQQDWCFAADQHELGVQALAVPLRDMQGRVVAALNAVATGTVVDPADFQRTLLPHLQEAARQMRAQL